MQDDEWARSGHGWATENLTGNPLTRLPPCAREVTLCARAVLIGRGAVK